MTRTDLHLAAWRAYRIGRSNAALAMALRITPLLAEHILINVGVAELEYGRMAAAKEMYDMVESILECKHEPHH